jgi:hypothetical protein
MYNPGTQVQIPTDANLGSYYLLKKLAVGVSPTAFLSKKTQIKERKSTERKTLSYLPRVLFFNAFELGAENGNQVFSNEALRSIVSSRAPLTTLGTLEVLEDDSTCKSLLVELKALPILKTCCGFGTDTLGTDINFCSFPTKAFSFLNLREEKIELRVSIDSSNLPILRI